MNLFSFILFKSSYKYECLFILLVFSFALVGCKGACTKYERTQFVEGMYYPNGTVNLVGRPVKSVDRAFVITVSHPFRVSELGILTPGWYDEPQLHGVRPPFEVGRAEVYKKKTYYIPLYQLNSTGRFEYYERSMSLKEWIRIHPIWTILISIILLIAIIYLIANFVNKQTRLIIIFSAIGVAIVLIIVNLDDVIKFISGLGVILLFALIGAGFDGAYSSDNNSNDDSDNDRYNDTDQAKSKTRCKNCRSLDMGTLLISKGDGRCKDCDGTGHDRTAEALVDFGSLGLVDGKINCETCHGTGQCQSCGGTGFIFS